MVAQTVSCFQQRSGEVSGCPTEDDLDASVAGGASSRQLCVSSVSIPGVIFSTSSSVHTCILVTTLQNSLHPSNTWWNHQNMRRQSCTNLPNKKFHIWILVVKNNSSSTKSVTCLQRWRQAHREGLYTFRRHIFRPKKYKYLVLLRYIFPL